MDEGAIDLVLFGDLSDLCLYLWVIFFGQNWQGKLELLFNG